MLNSLVFLASDLSIEVLSCGLKTLWTLSCTVPIRTELPLFHVGFLVSQQGHAVLARNLLRSKWSPVIHSWLPAPSELSMTGHCQWSISVLSKKKFETSRQVGRMKTHLSNFLILLPGCPQDTDTIAHMSPSSSTIKHTYCPA